MRVRVRHLAESVLPGGDAPGRLIRVGVRVRVRVGVRVGMRVGVGVRVRVICLGAG